ncbi:MAG: chitosanase [Pyrinomonadaceae bacterium]
MTYTDKDKLKALAIVNIFETSRPFGDYAACVVLNDGAGVSYGINQFTHRSGSLAAVVEGYLDAGGKIGRDIFLSAMPILRRTTAFSITKLAADAAFKAALRAAAVTREMKESQKKVAFERYLRPALEICRERAFVLPLSLAVVYDSVTHGSWERIAARTGAENDEKTWIIDYVRKRHLWLTNIPRLKATNYRTKFFLDQIAIGNWNLRLPIIAHGVRLNGGMFGDVPSDVPQPRAPARSGVFETADTAISAAAQKFDRVEAVVTAVVTRKDAAKSLWTTILGTLWQAAWAIFGFVAGLPPEVWIVVALIAALLMLAYLYRQLEMGRIREKSQLKG